MSATSSASGTHTTESGSAISSKFKHTIHVRGDTSHDAQFGILKYQSAGALLLLGCGAVLSVTDVLSQRAGSGEEDVGLGLAAARGNEGRVARDDAVGMELVKEFREVALCVSENKKATGREVVDAWRGSRENGHLAGCEAPNWTHSLEVVVELC